MHRGPPGGSAACLLLVLVLGAAPAAQGQNRSAAKASAEGESAPPGDGKSDASAAEDAAESATDGESAGDSGEGAAEGGDATAADPPVDLNFIDLDEDASPTPKVYSFKGQVRNFKIGAGSAFATTAPYGHRSGYGQLFTEGDWSVGATGVGLHWDLDLRMGLGFFEPRANPFAPPQLVTQENVLTDNINEVRPNAGNLTPQAVSFYRRQLVFATGRNTDYLRIDKLYLSWDHNLFGVDVGRVRVPEMASVIVDGAQVRLDFDRFRLGFFGGFRPNPWHQQVVGASSGGFLPLEILPTGGQGPFEYFQTRWGETFIEDAYLPSGNTTGPYSNEVGLTSAGFGLGYPLPWTQLGSIRFPAAGAHASLRYDPVFMDVGMGMDLFGDPVWAVCPDAPNAAANVGCDPGVLYKPDNPSLFGATPLGLDRVYATTTGGVRVFDPLTIAWRGTLDIIGARPLWFRDLFLDATWRNLGPFNISASYFKINTYATAYSYFRFFRPLENVALNTPALNAGDDPLRLPAEGVNNTNLFVVDRDRVTLSISSFLWGSLQGYLDLIGERRNDFEFGGVTPQFGLGSQFSGWASGLQNLADLDQQSQQFQCNQQVERDGNGNIIVPPGALQGSNPQFPVWTDRCKLGFTLGVRDSVLANIGNFDIHATHMQGYYSANSRLSGRLGVAVLDTLWLNVGAGGQRNFVHRVYGPACDKDGVCPPNYTPADNAENQAASWAYVPQALIAYQLSADFSWRIWDGWYVEGSYFGWLEELPFQGDYYDWRTQVPITRDPYQLTHTVYVRTLYRFF